MMVFVSTQLDIYWESYDILKFSVYEISKILAQWPKYVVILNNFDKNSREIIQILCIAYKKL